MHIPAVFAALAITAEFAGSLGLIVGLLGRVAAFGIGVEMAVAAFVGGHVANGFFMNWSGHQAGEGFEYHILVVVIALAVMIKGSGALSLDRLLGAGSR
jgi:putative oxidoreductase